MEMVRGRQVSKVRGNACTGYVTTQERGSWLLALVWHIPSGRGKGCEAGEREAGERQCLHRVCDNTRNVLLIAGSGVAQSIRERERM